MRHIHKAAGFVAFFAMAASFQALGCFPFDIEATRENPTGGTAGSGGVPACTVANDCPNTGGPCMTPACVNGLCEATPVPEGTVLPMNQQVQGDCSLVVCGSDGMPSPDPEPDVMDVPASTECNTGACNGTMPIQNPTPGMCGPGNVGTCNQGVCKLPNGTACSSNGQCTSTFCVDGVCCNNACTITCLACNIAPALGQCSTLAPGEQDPNAMTPCSSMSQACDAAGACVNKLPNGSACAGGADCASGQCLNNVCVAP